MVVVPLPTSMVDMASSSPPPFLPSPILPTSSSTSFLPPLPAFPPASRRNFLLEPANTGSYSDRTHGSNTKPQIQTQESIDHSIPFAAPSLVRNTPVHEPAAMDGTPSIFLPSSNDRIVDPDPLPPHQSPPSSPFPAFDPWSAFASPFTPFLPTPSPSSIPAPDSLPSPFSSSPFHLPSPIPTPTPHFHPEPVPMPTPALGMGTHANELDAFDIESIFHIVREIGSGSFGNVYLCTHKATGQQLAMKLINKFRPNVNYEMLVEKVDALMAVKGLEVVLDMHYFYEDTQYCYLVTDYCARGTLQTLLEQQGGRINTEQVPEIFKQLLFGVWHCHQRGIVHRDLKLENILLSSTVELDGEILVKLADFGLCDRLAPNQKLRGSCGTPLFMPPEVCSNLEYDFKADVWSLGVILYYMLYGDYPFSGSTVQEVVDKIIYDQVNYSPSVSHSANHLIQSMLVKDPNERAPLQLLIEHPFLA